MENQSHLLFHPSKEFLRLSWLKPNRLIAIETGKTDRNKDLSESNQRQIEKKLEEQKKKLETSHPDKTKIIKKTFKELNEEIKNLAKNGLTETEKNQIEKKLGKSIDDILDTKLMAEEVASTKEISGKEVHMFVEKIAANHGTTVAELERLNPGKIKKVTKVGGGFKQEHIDKGLHYVFAETELIVPVAHTAAKQRELEAANLELITPERRQTVEERFQERDEKNLKEDKERKAKLLDEQEKLKVEVLKIAETENGLKGKSVTVPQFLKPGKLRIDVNTWERRVEFAGQKDKAQEERVAQLIQRPPLGWSYNEFRDVIREGRNRTFTFNDITKHEYFGKNENEFFARYHALDGLIAAEKNGGTKKGLQDEKKHREDVMVQAFQILHAFEEIQAVAEGKPESAHEEISHQPNLETIPTIKTDQAAYTRELNRLLFQNDQTLSAAEIRDGENLRYSRTNYLSREKGANAALNDIIMNQVGDYDENGVFQVDEQTLQDYLKAYLEAGVRGYAQDPNLDILVELDLAGVAIDTKDRAKIQEVDRTITHHAEKHARLEKEVEWETDQNAKSEKITQLEYRMRLIAQEIEVQKKVKADILENGGYLDALLNQVSINPEDRTKPTAQQKRFIQNGYRINGGRDLKKQGEQIRALRKGPRGLPAQKETLSKFGENAMITEALLELAKNESLKGLTESEWREIARKIEDGLKEKFKFEGLESRTVDKGGFGIGLITKQLKAKNFKIGAFKSIPIRDSNPPLTFNLGIGTNVQKGEGIQGVAGGAGAAVKQEFENGQILWSIDAGVGVSEKGVNGGVGLGGMGTRGLENVNLIAGAGFGLSLKDLKLGVGGRIGFQRKEDLGETAVLEGTARSGMDFLDRTDLNDEQKVDKIRQMEDFKEMASQLSMLSPEAEEAVLLGMAKRIRHEYQSAAVADLKVHRFKGVEFAVLPVFPFVIPIVSFEIGGKPYVYFDLPRTLEPQKENSEANIQAQLEQWAKQNEPGAEPEFIHNRGASEKALDLAKIGYQLESGNRILLPKSQKECNLVMGGLMQERLAASNQNLARIGIHLSPAEKEYGGLLKLDIGGVDDPEMPREIRPRLDIRIDPKMKGKIVVGNPPSLHNLYLAIDQLEGQNLIVTREEFDTPRQELGAYRYTRITIKSNPHTTFNQLETEKSDLMQVEANGALHMHHQQGEKSILEWKKMTPEEKKALVKGQEGLSFDLGAYFKENAATTDKNLSEALKPTAEAIPTEQLNQLAKNFYKKHSKEVLAATLVDEDQSEDMQKLIIKLKEFASQQKPPMVLNDTNLGFTVNVLHKLTYAQGGGRTPEKQKEYLKRHHEWFKQVLADHFGENIAASLLKDIEASTAEPQTMNERAEIFTVVSIKGVRGLRSDTIQTGKILKSIDVDDPTMKKQILAEIRKFPKQPEAFLHTSLALRAYEHYALLKGPKGKKAMDAIYQDPSKILEHQAVFKEFQEVVHALHQSEVENTAIPLTTEWGMELLVRVKTDVVAGLLEYCDNPTIGLTEDLLVVLPGEGIGVRNQEAVKGRYGIEKPIRTFMAAFSTGIPKRDKPRTSNEGQSEVGTENDTTPDDDQEAPF